ncbi:VOC family protein [Gordonia sp. (in: high G+C Gram-positive bacteria)]|uniref:VOC family protein n=1 Tax=Gordonia sp. (in: high G+C Gram-positive bacteria) TaxID=84139 RepID=UPI003C758EDB
MSTQSIVPNLWCNANAEQVAQFYAAAFPDTTWQVLGRYPTEGLPEFQQRFAGLPVAVEVVIGGYRIGLINADDTFAPNRSISFLLNFDPASFASEAAARDQLDAMWGILWDGGSPIVPLDEYPHSKRYGWLRDQFGVTWHLMLTDPEGPPRPFITPLLLFSGDVGHRARAAIAKYTALFTPSAVGTVASAPQSPEAVMYADFQLNGQWFAAMDTPELSSSGPDQESFNCGVSLEVQCADQAEIDRIWDGLTAVPEAEMCGWLADEFGVSWQVTPANMGELMARPNAYQHMLAMKKIIIADL